MVTRKEMDVPAMAIAGVMGLVLLVGSLPFTYDAFCRKEGCPGAEATEPRTFDVSWAVMPYAASTPLQLSAAAPEGSVTLNATDVQVAVLEVRITACTDTARAPLQQPAQVTLTLEGAGDLEPVTFTCASQPEEPVFRVELAQAPDLAQVQASNATAALADAYARTQESNVTAAYTLRAAAERADGTPVPLPGGPLDPTLDVAFTMSLSRYTPMVSEAPEVLR